MYRISGSFLARLLLVVCGLFAPAFLFAQDFKFNHLGRENGLSQSVVNCVLQDHNGFMWFGTQEGLNRYDGYTFKVYKRIPGDTTSLSNNFIYSLCEDHLGNIWIGTNGGGVNVFNPATDKFLHYQAQKSKRGTLSNNIVRSIVMDNQNRIWVGTDAGLNLFNRAKQNFTTWTTNPNDPYSLPEKSIYALVCDLKGQLWIGTYGSGISRFSETEGKFYTYIFSESQIKKFSTTEVLSQMLQFPEKINQVRSLLVYDKDKLWVGTDGAGLAVFDLNANEFIGILLTHPQSKSRIHSMTEDGEGNIWLGMYEKGLNIYSRGEGVFQEYVPDARDKFSIRSSSVKVVYADRSHNVWLGTNGDGIDVSFKSSSIISHIRRSERPGVGDNTLRSNEIFATLEDYKGDIWIGSYGGGLSRLHRSTGEFVHFPELSTSGNNAVLSLLETRDSSLWVGTWGDGINRYFPKTGQIIKYSPKNVNRLGTVLCLTEDPVTNHVWAGTLKEGLYNIDPATGKYTRFTKDSSGLVSNDINCLYVEKDGTLWIGTRTGGVMCRNAQTGNFITIQHNDADNKSLSANLVYCITEDLSGNIWISTSNGLNRYDKRTRQITSWYERDGLPSDNIYGIVVDANGKLWLSHNRGITLFDPTKTGIESFRNFTPGSGVQSGEFNQGAYSSTRRGEIVFGGQEGINIVDPQKINRRSEPPPVFITSYKRFEKEVMFNDSIITRRNSIEVSWRDNYFQFEVAALDFVDPSRNLYQYKLEGFDDDWSPATNNRFISYTNLPGGSYTLRVRACNSSGEWNENGLSLRIVVKPPFWRTNWFYALCIFLAIIGVILFTRLRTASIRKEKRILEEKVAERTRELAQKNEDITSSIEYARRIQFAILPELEHITNHFPENFILYRPKDIVSGDFFWFAERSGRKIFVVADCTGHGVPGALMSVIGHNLLNQLVLEKGITEPSEILRQMNQGVRAALKQDQGEQDTADGMDMIVCTFEGHDVLYAGALRPLVVVRNDGTLRKMECDRYTIGGAQDIRERTYTTHRFRAEKGDMLYFFTDGYADQFGGPNGKKLMMKRLLEIFAHIHKLPVLDQMQFLETEFENWRNENDQIDDVLVAGIKIA
ncbi:MAG: SpoIIE family protein phosphatase [Bacteroidia bacterium]|jgi:ligand-binding sensor domain-containing protein/serine phosphatase RsbU (regulator of sigma subunit)|nr:SpoIIE family protein phosphatase [Bacteroidia bacterium]